MRISDWSSDVCSSDLIRIERRIEHWTRFGRIAAERIVSRKTRMVSFRPDAVFSLVRWTSNDYGTIHSRIDLLRAVMPGEGYTPAPFVQPGGELYLSLQGWPKLRAVPAATHAVDAAGAAPFDAPPDPWP